MSNCLVNSQTESVIEALFCNVLHEKVSFTKKLKFNKQLYFLNIFLLYSKSKVKFLTIVYKKLSFIGQCLPFQSFCTKKRKINLIRTLYHRNCMIFVSWFASFWNKKHKGNSTGNLLSISAFNKSHKNTRWQP